MVVVLVAVGLAGVGILLVLFIALLQQLRRVAGAMGQIEAELRPILEDIRQDARRAEEQLRRFQERSGAQRPAASTGADER